jgi:hypothetical protein
MFFYSGTDLASWGANLPGSPVIGVSDPVEHLTQFVVVVQRWSDGTEYREALLRSIIISTDMPTGPLRTRSFEDAVGWCDRW